MVRLGGLHCFELVLSVRMLPCWLCVKSVCPNYWFCRKLCQFCGSAVLGLLFCVFSGSSWLVSLEMVSTCDVLGGTLSVVFRIVLPLVLGDVLPKTLPVSWGSGAGFGVLWIF